MLDQFNESARFDIFINKYIKILPFIMLGLGALSLIIKIIGLNIDLNWLRGDILYLIDQLTYLPLWILVIAVSIEFGYCIAHRIFIYFFMFCTYLPALNTRLGDPEYGEYLFYLIIFIIFSFVFFYFIYIFFHVIPGKERKQIEELKKKINDLEIEIGIKDNME